MLFLEGCCQARGAGVLGRVAALSASGARCRWDTDTKLDIALFEVRMAGETGGCVRRTKEFPSVGSGLAGGLIGICRAMSSLVAGDLVGGDGGGRCLREVLRTSNLLQSSHSTQVQASG